MVLTLAVRARPRGETRRAQILDAALTVFLEHGYDRATIDLVVRRASASKATIYSFFGGKEGLFEALVGECAERILAGFPDVDGGIIDVRAALKNIAQRYLEVVMAPDAVALWRLIVAEGPRFPGLAKDVYRVSNERLVARLAKALRTWSAGKRIRPLDADQVARQFLAVVRGDLHILALSGLLPDDLETAIHKNVQEAVKTFWPALRRKDGERS
jgi:AcrR family transcriptional regulator